MVSMVSWVFPEWNFESILQSSLKFYSFS
ncbi:hypothetical protein OCT59_000036 [Rhizophagus irregularis]|nr:hypothetical protein OCT59_000036 [Rhizophagus irregularis]